MQADIKQGFFKKSSWSKAEIRADITDRIAREITNAETNKREAKTERLREARLAREKQASSNAERTNSQSIEAKNQHRQSRISANNVRNGTRI